MANIFKGALVTIINLIVILPVAFLFYHEFQSFPTGIAWLVSAGVFLVYGSAGYFLYNKCFSYLSCAKVSFVCVVTIAGLGVVAANKVFFLSADFSTLHHSDRSATAHALPTKIAAHGKFVQGYHLHPPFEGTKVTDALEAEFVAIPKRVTILFSKPKDALLLPDGTSTLSDGVSVEVNAFSRDGSVQFSRQIDILQSDFLSKRWLEYAIDEPEGVAKVSVRVTAGPPGSTPYYDSTIVAFETNNVSNTLKISGQILLGGFAGFCLALFIVLYGKALSVLSPALRFVWRWLPHFLIVCIPLGVAYWSGRNSAYIFFWDYRNYWQKTEQLYELLITSSWGQFGGLVGSYYSADYSMFPAIAPAVFSAVVGYPTYLTYLMAITLLYAVPAYIATAYLAKKLVESSSTSEQLPRESKSIWLVAGVAVIFCTPSFFSNTLNLMPDIGGVIFLVVALLCANKVTSEIVLNPGQSEPLIVSAELLRSSLALGILIGLLFLFRRWYAFAIAGISVSCILVIMLETWRKLRFCNGERIFQLKIIVLRTLAAAAIATFAATPFLSWILFDWVGHLGQHDYSSLYSSYQVPLAEDARRFVSAFGLLIPAICVVSVICLYRFCSNRGLLFILVITSMVAVLLFFRVQSPGRHHYLLLMPLFAATIAAFINVVFQRYGASIAAAVVAVIIGGNASVTWLNGERAWASYIFSSYEGWLPKHQPYIRGFEELARWLITPENKTRKICVIASSAHINQSVIGEIWQVVPTLSKKEFEGRLIDFGEVDSRDGHPRDSIKQCEIALVGRPLQRHLRPGEQEGIEMIYRDLIDGTGVAAAYDSLPVHFSMDEAVKISAYIQKRKISDDEYLNLVERFYKKKGLQGNPPGIGGAQK